MRSGHAVSPPGDAREPVMRLHWDFPCLRALSYLQSNALQGSQCTFSGVTVEKESVQPVPEAAGLAMYFAYEWWFQRRLWENCHARSARQLQATSARNKVLLLTLSKSTIN